MTVRCHSRERVPAICTGCGRPRVKGIRYVGAEGKAARHLEEHGVEL